MKVNHITSYPPWKGGIADYSKMLIDELDTENTIISFKQAEGENVILVMDKEDKPSFVKAADKVFENDPDVIHIQHELNLYGRVNFLGMALRLLHLKKNNDAKIVTTMHTYIDYNFSLKPKPFLRYLGYKQLTYRLIFRLSDKIIVHNNVLKDKIGRENVEVIPHGVKKIECGEDIREDYGFDENDTFLLCVGFLSEVKGFEYAVKAMKHLPEHYKLLLTGTKPPNFPEAGQKYLEKMQEIVSENDLEDQVVIKEEFIPEDKLDKLICSADLNIFPYIESSQSGMMHRAIGAGKNIICSDLEVFKSVLGNSAKYFETKNPRDLAEKIEDGENNSEISKLREELSWNKIAEKHQKIYQSVK